MRDPKFVEVGRFDSGGRVNALAISDDGNHLAVALAPDVPGARVRLYDSRTGSMVLEFGADQAWARGAVFASTNGFVWAALTTQGSHDIRLVRTPVTGPGAGMPEIVHTYGARERFFGLLAGPGGARIGVVGDSVDIWSAGPPVVVDHAEPSAPRVRMAAAIGDAGTWLSGAMLNQVVCRALGGEVLVRLDATGLPPIAVVSPSPNGHHILVQSDGVKGLRLWDTATGGVLHPSRWGVSSRTALWAWTPDSEWLITASVGFFAFRITDLAFVQGPAIPKSVDVAAARSAPVIAAASEAGVVSVVRFE